MEDLQLRTQSEVHKEAAPPLESVDPIVIQEQLFGAAAVPAELKTTSQTVEHLRPHNERANDGTDRVIFTAGNTSFSFKSPEEYPIYPAQQRANTTLLTQASKRPMDTIDALDYDQRVALRELALDDYSQAVARHSPAESEEHHFTVDHSLTGMLRLATVLRPDDQSLRQLAGEVQKGIYSERSLLMLDAMAAASYVNERGEITYEPDANGDALVIDSLLGNTDAQAQVAARVARLHEHDLQKAQSDHDTRQEHYSASADNYRVPEGEKEPQPGDFMAIHATGHRPQRDEAGRIILQTRFDTVGFSRPSLHFSINHLVGSHTLGQFDDAPYVVMTPFDEMLAANGKPKNIVDVDTWWTRNPGESVACPDATLVEPNDSESVGLFVREADSLKYKTSDFTEDNIDQLVTSFAKIEGSALLPYIPESMRKSITEQANSVNNVGRLLQSNPELKQTVVDALQEGQAQADVAQGLRYLAKKLAVDTVLQEHDIEIFLNSEEGTSGQSKRIPALAKNLDVESSAHGETPEYRMEQQRHEKHDPSDPVVEDIASLDPKSRRVLMASGIKAARRAVADTFLAFDEVG